MISCHYSHTLHSDTAWKLGASSMHDELENTAVERLLDILRSSPIPLSTRDLGARLRLQHQRLPDYKIGSLLRSMIGEGQVEYRRSRWVAPSSSQKISHSSPVSPPRLSTETLSYLNRGSSYCPRTVSPGGVEWTEPKTDLSETEAPSGRWETFRKLLAYYRQCISNEEGAEASAGSQTTRLPAWSGASWHRVWITWSLP